MLPLQSDPQIQRAKVLYRCHGQGARGELTPCCLTCNSPAEMRAKLPHSSCPPVDAGSTIRPREWTVSSTRTSVRIRRGWNVVNETTVAVPDVHFGLQQRLYCQLIWAGCTIVPPDMLLIATDVVGR